LCRIPVAQSLRSAALPVIFFLTLAALLLWLSGLLSGLAAMLSALPALLARSPLSGLTALLSLLTTLLTVFLHIVCHEHSPPSTVRGSPRPVNFRYEPLVAAGKAGVGSKNRRIKIAH
jgi:hypothetical protein